MERLLEILEEIRPDVDFINEASLIDGGILDSFDLAMIISELNDEYEVAIRVTHLSPENFNSVQSIFKLVESLKNQS